MMMPGSDTQSGCHMQSSPKSVTRKPFALRDRPCASARIISSRMSSTRPASEHSASVETIAYSARMNSSS